MNTKTVIGIIAELNPLHNGHRALFDYARDTLHAKHIVVALSGDFVQRGEPTLFRKFDRAALAVTQGVDLVLEIPVVGATASAEVFAATGVGILTAAGVVDTLLFATEDGALPVTTEDATLPATTKDGTLPAGNKPLAPNALLATHYLRALDAKKSTIRPVAMRRLGTPHDAPHPKENYASASAIRRALLSHRFFADAAMRRCLPDAAVRTLERHAINRSLLSADDASVLLHQRLLTEPSFSDYLDCHADLSDKLVKYRDFFDTFTGFAHRLKSKELTYSRICRMLTHILLGITDEDRALLQAEAYAPYLRILAHSDAAAPLLSAIKKATDKPLFSAPQQIRSPLSEAQAALLRRDLFADDLYRALLTAKSGRVYPTEFTRRV